MFVRTQWIVSILFLCFALVLSGCTLGVPGLLGALILLICAALAACGAHSSALQPDADTVSDSDSTDNPDSSTGCDSLCPAHMTCSENTSGEMWCFPDADEDNIRDEDDNCPYAPNEEQTDTDDDGLGDACDLCDGGDLIDPTCGEPCCIDHDGDRAEISDDTVLYVQDNCGYLPNADQSNRDNDYPGDVCDIDPDLEGTPLSPCGFVHLDDDGDGIENSGCDPNDDPCPYTPSAGSGDYDSDGTPDVCDNDGIPTEGQANIDLNLLRKAILNNLLDQNILEKDTVQIAMI